MVGGERPDMAKSRLRLLAHDEEDLEILSAHLQDSVIRVGDMAFLPRARRFVALVNRFCWESEHDEAGPCQRMRAGLHFDGVLRVKTRRIRQDDPDAVLELLAIRFTRQEDGAGAIDLFCAAGGLIRLEVECIDATLSDIGAPWPAKARPVHDLEAKS